MLYLALALATVLVALSFGFSYGNVGNQATYLPHALHDIDPGFLSKDWLVRDTTVYHGNFRWIVVLLSALGSVAWGGAILNTCLIVLSIYLLFRWLNELHAPRALGAAVLLLLFVALDATESVGDAYLFSGGIQPSVIATTGWIAAIWVYLRGSIGLSGALLAFAGLFHANFLVLGIGLFTLAQVFQGRDALPSRWLKQVGPSLLVLLFSLPLILEAAQGQGAAEARRIFLEIRAPHHYLPLTYLFDFWYLCGWLVCGAAVAWFMPDLSRRKPLLALLGAFSVSIAGGTALTTLVFIPQISQLYVWRLAPFLLVLCQALVALFLMRQLLEAKDAPRPHPLLLLALGAGALAILRWVIRYTGPSPQFAAVALVLALYLLMCFLRRGAGPWMPRLRALFQVAALCLIVFVSVPRIGKAFEESTILHPRADELVNWVRTTDPGAVFLVPPELGDLRLLGERAVVVDWKSTPVKPAELIAWYERISAVAGQPVGKLEDAVNGYRRRTPDELQRLATEFGADYIVVDKTRHFAGHDAQEPVFQSGLHSVYRAHPPALTGAAR